MNLIEKVFGTHSERELKLIRPIVDKILGMREQMVALSDDELRDNTRQVQRAPCKRRDAGRPPAGGICNRA